MASKLSKPQERELKRVYEVRSDDDIDILWTDDKTIIRVWRNLEKMGLIEIVLIGDYMGNETYDTTLTEAGQALAAELFGTPEPAAPQVSVDPAAAPDASEPVSKPEKFSDIVEAVAQYAFETDAYEMQYVNCINHVMGEDYYGNLSSSLKQTRLFNAVYKRVDELWTEKIDKKSNPVADSSIPFAEGFVEDSEAAIKPTIWTHKLPVAQSAPRYQKTRKSSHTRDFKARKLSSTMNIEKNTPRALNWRKRRNLANATAMPQPSITGMGLLRQAQLTVVEKPRKLTTILETRAA